MLDRSISARPALVGTGSIQAVTVECNQNVIHCSLPKDDSRVPPLAQSREVKRCAVAQGLVLGLE